MYVILFLGNFCNNCICPANDLRTLLKADFLAAEYCGAAVYVVDIAVSYTHLDVYKSQVLPQYCEKYKRKDD